MIGRPGIVVPDHHSNVTVILQNCGDTDIHIPRGALLGNVENSSLNKLKLSKKQQLDAEKV
jgi:hypothetical protein